jgi:hypothetical protein
MYDEDEEVYALTAANNAAAAVSAAKKGQGRCSAAGN